MTKKVIAKCLTDSNGNSRPFSFIALGGSSNGSFLEGHNYTYVGSNYGKNCRDSYRNTMHEPHNIYRWTW